MLKISYDIQKYYLNYELNRIPIICDCWAGFFKILVNGKTLNSKMNLKQKI
jgi:hypothetical protein